MSRTVDLQGDMGDILLTEEEIAAKVAELGRRIGADYAGRNLTLVSVLKGSLPFMADLMRQIPLPLRIDLMEVSSYGGPARPSRPAWSGSSRTCPRRSRTRTSCWSRTSSTPGSRSTT